MKDRAQPALLTVNCNRFKQLTDITPEDYALPFYCQPLVIETIQKSVIPAGGVIGGVIGLIVGGLVGIVPGSAIGAVTGYVAQVFGRYACAWYV